jgi:hypothetical protein
MINLNISETIRKLTRTNFSTKIFLGVLFFALIFSLVMFFINGYSQRRVFLFENLDKDGLYAENRYFPKNQYLDEVELYVSELLLGPIGERYKPIFSPGTKLKSCFLRDETLYVDLTSQALFPDKKVSEIREGAEIFKKNIFRNFRKIDKINIYIEGRKIFDE